MTETGAHHEVQKRKTVGQKVHEAIDALVHPVSSAREKQFREVINVLPQGALKQSYERMLPRLREMLKIQDFDTATGELIMRGAAFLFGGAFTAIGIGASVASGTPIGVLHAAVGLGVMASAFAPFGPIARERKAIANEAVTYKDFYSTPAGRDAARAWDKLPGQNTDQIVRAILLGTPQMKATPGGAIPMTNSVASTRGLLG